MISFKSKSLFEINLPQLLHLIANTTGLGAFPAITTKIILHIILAFISRIDVTASSLWTIICRWAFALAFVIDIAFAFTIWIRGTMGIAFVHDVDNFVVVESGSSMIANG